MKGKIKLLLLLLCFFCISILNAQKKNQVKKVTKKSEQPVIINQYNNKGPNYAGGQIINQYKIIKKYYPSEDDRAFLSTAFQLSSLRSVKNQPENLIKKYEFLYRLCITSLTDKTFYSQNKKKIHETMNGIFNAQTTAFKNEFTLNSKKEYSNIKNSIKDHAIKKYTYGTYEGVLVDDQPNGFGKFTWNNGDIYMGQYKDGLWDGFGYWEVKGKSKHLGTFEHGEMVGFGITYFSNGDVYEGEFKNSKRNGTGIMTFKNKDVFIGNFVNGLKGADGLLFYAKEGVKYIGEFNDGEPNGLGTIVSMKNEILPTIPGCGRYVGSLKNGKLHGFGRCYDVDGKLIYEGHFFNDEPKLKYPNRSTESQYKEVVYNENDIYKGYFVGRIKEGQGELLWANGDHYKGEWRNDLMHGYGVMQFGSGDAYEGQCKFGTNDGYGIFSIVGGNKLIGFFKSNYAKGFAKLDTKEGFTLGFFENFDIKQKMISVSTGDMPVNYCDSSYIYMGEVQDGKKNGYGICFTKEFKLVYEGIFLDDKPIQPCP